MAGSCRSYDAALLATLPRAFLDDGIGSWVRGREQVAVANTAGIPGDVDDWGSILLVVGDACWILGDDGMVWRTGRAETAGWPRHVDARIGGVRFVRAETWIWGERCALEGDTLAFAENWKKNQWDEGEALQDDGNCYCALLDAAGALF